MAAMILFRPSLVRVNFLILEPCCRFALNNTQRPNAVYIRIRWRLQVLHVNGSSGELLGRLKIAAEKVSSVTFGGPRLDKLYVTTISEDVEAEKFNEYPMTGKVLEVTGLGVRGTLGRRVRNKCFG